jgi:hypothetical protein
MNAPMNEHDHAEQHAGQRLLVRFHVNRQGEEDDRDERGQEEPDRPSALLNRSSLGDSRCSPRLR